MVARGQDRQRAALASIETYWQALRAERGPVPPRSSVDPRGMEDALESAFLLHHIAPGIARLRVAGSHLNDLSGMEVAGMPLSALFVPAARDGLADALRQVFGGPALLRADLVSPAGFARSELRASLLILPLTCDAGGVDRALGGLVSQGAIGRTPRRFEIAAIKVEPLAGLATTTGVRPRTRHFAEAPAPYAPRAAKTAPHLRVVVSND
ncbi:PAS domain-containing protein [Roseivivax sp. CAU 1753]